MDDDADVRAALERVLSGRYVVEREIGRGGMGIVFQALDLRHDRKVALKVIRPGLAMAAGSARFVREISVVAHLDHPHILPLYDSGEVDGLPYYIMPHIEGASLDDLLRREGQLSIEEAVELTCQVALALDHAHEHGVVHRDIKPQNILLSNRQAIVADFGLAGALSDAGEEKLTATGFAMGSPHYMSPEQAGGMGHVDRRSDVYSLGCVLYEMLLGQPPFTGPTRHAIIARHSAQPVPGLRLVRDTIPPELEQVVVKSLAKVPADRFRTAGEFAEALHGSIARSRETKTVSGAVARAITPRSIIVLGAMAIAVAAAVVLSMGRPDPPVRPRPVDGVIAVLPFQFSGAPDSEAVSPASIVELLSARLSAPGVTVAIDPELVLREVRGRVAPGEQLTERDAIGVARTLGADLAMLGNVHATAGRVVMSGSLLSVDDGEILHRIEALASVSDSLVGLLDRFAIPFLLERVGESWRRPEELTTQTLEAVKLYVSGVKKHRRGQYATAAADLERALQADPVFTLARVRLAMIHGAAGNIESALGAMEMAWTQRGSLARADSIFLVAMIGEDHPAPTSYSKQIEKWEWVVDSLPRHWEGSYELGDLLFHWGPAVGKEIPHSRARVAFRAALANDSAYAPALEHLIDLAAANRDVAELRRLANLYAAVNPGADHADYVRWRLAVGIGDVPTRQAIRQRFDSVPRAALEQIIGMSQLDGVALEDAVDAVAELGRRARNEYDMWFTGVVARELALNRGRPTDVPRGTRDYYFALPLDSLYRVVEALYASGDSAAGHRVVNAWRGAADSALPSDADASSREYMMICGVNLWRLAHGPNDSVSAGLSRLQAVRGGTERRSRMYLPVCAATLDARHAAHRNAPEAQSTRQRLDSLLRSGPVTNKHIQLAARRTLAELEEQGHNLHGALATVRRRPYHPLLGVVGLSEMVREEGRLAALTGDTVGAIRAYRHFLVLRANAEHPLDRANGEVRAALATLGAESVR